MGPDTTFIERLPLIPEKPVLRYGITIVLCLAALLLRVALDDVFPPGYPYLTFFPAVILSSFLYGPRPGIVAALLCGLFAWYFFIPPRGSMLLNNGTFVALAFYGFVVTVDIGLVQLMQRANRRLRSAREQVHALAEERGRLADRAELLFQELQHRVGNNLQMVGAMLALQLRGLTDTAARKAINDAAERLQVIGRIQRELYKHDGNVVPLDAFVSDLIGKLQVTTAHPEISVRIEARSGVVLRSEAAVPVALIVAEAVANAVEHGCLQRGEGNIVVTTTPREDGAVILVQDDGPGLPDNFEANRSSNMGLRLCQAMARQLGAQYTLSPSDSDASGDTQHVRNALSGGTMMQLILPTTQLSALS